MHTTKVLIIEDDRTTRESLHMLLEFEGYTVSTSENGIAALDLVKNGCFEVLIIDYRMPGMYGDEVTRLARRMCPDSLIIGFSIEEKEEMFLDAGADAFINKSALAHELVPFIRKRIQH